jgi:hypothetical protein
MTDKDSAHTVKLSVRIACVLDVSDPLLHDNSRDYWPAVRGSFQQLRFESPAVGKKFMQDGADKPTTATQGIAALENQVGTWEEVVMTRPSVGTTETVPTSKKGNAKESKSTKDSKAGKETGGIDFEASRPIDRKLFVFQRDLPEFKADLDFAWKMNDDPNFHVFLSLVPEARLSGTEEAAAKAAGKKSTEKDKGASGSTQAGSLAPHMFTSWLPVDCSPMFVGESSCSMCFGSTEIAMDAVNPDASQSAVDESLVETQHAFLESVIGSKLPTTTLPAPGGFHFLYITVFISSCSIEQKEAAVVPLTAKAKPPSKVAAPAETVHSIHPPRLIADHLLAVLQPLRMCVRLADSIPGITVAEFSDLSMQRFCFPTPYHLLSEFCGPTIIVVRIADYFDSLAHKSPNLCLQMLDDKVTLPHTALCKNAIPRLIVTPGLRHNSQLRWNYTAVYCVGAIQPAAVAELFETKPIEVELHDRRLLQWETLQEQGLPADTLAVTPVEDAPVVQNSTIPQGSKTAKPLGPPAPAAKALLSPRAKPAETVLVKPPTNGITTETALTCVCKADWPFLMLPVSRVQFYEGLCTGAVLCPYASLHSHDTAAGAAAPLGQVQRSTKSGSPRASVVAGGKDKEKGKVDTKAAADASQETFRHSQAEIDQLFVREALLRISVLRERHPHAVGQLRLNDLLRSTPPYSHEAPCVEGSTFLFPRNRLYIPATPEPLWALSERQRMCQLPGPYNTNGSRVKMRCSLPCGNTFLLGSSQRQFERMVVSFLYSDDIKLSAIVDEIERINCAACPQALSFRTYELNAEETAAANAGMLDLITGCQIIDGSKRLFLLEGIAGGSIANLRALLPRTAMNNESFALLANPSITFQTRMYTAFHIAPRYIRLRVLLRSILEHPGSYDAENVSRELMDTLESLQRVVKARSLHEAKTFEFFPSSTGLLELENKYGGPVSLVDVFGESHPDAQALVTKHAELQQVEMASAGHLSATTDVSKLLSATFAKTFASRTGSPRLDQGLSTPVLSDTHFSESHHSARNFLAENIQSVHDASVCVQTKRHARSDGGEEWTTFPVEGPVVSYSGQKLNSRAAQMAALRQHLAADKDATFTTSLEFVSQTIGVVDPSEISKTEARLSQSKWKTPKGFVYPAPRPVATYAVHPNRLTEARVRDLQLPWVDQAEEAALGDAEARALASKSGGRPQFRNTPIPVPLKDGTFGYLSVDGAPFAREEYFKSVHLPPGDWQQK